jgi:hypothetical protein
VDSPHHGDKSQTCRIISRITPLLCDGDEDSHGPPFRLKLPRTHSGQLEHEFLGTVSRTRSPRKRRNLPCPTDRRSDTKLIRSGGEQLSCEERRDGD